MLFITLFVRTYITRVSLQIRRILTRYRIPRRAHDAHVGTLLLPHEHSVNDLLEMYSLNLVWCPISPDKVCGASIEKPIQCLFENI